MNHWTAKVIIAAIAGITMAFIFWHATLVGIERTKTCRVQPQLCDTHLSPRVELPE
ncbi:hypothetical protein LCGC14_1062000 [marine sediment metagenome]|uniref:Uncharacterized protein n=1 Tax=marine sediment metagenome TaxID=412755 RepID=A0A0F9MQE5_9ZZZZ